MDIVKTVKFLLNPQPSTSNRLPKAFRWWAAAKKIAGAQELPGVVVEAVSPSKTFSSSVRPACLVSGAAYLFD